MESVDQEARNAAAHALAAIEKHEAVCAERWKQSRDAMEAIRREGKEGLDALRRGVEGLYEKFSELQDRLGALQLTQATDKGKVSGILKTLSGLGGAAIIGAAIAQIIGSFPQH